MTLSVTGSRQHACTDGRHVSVCDGSLSLGPTQNGHSSTRWGMGKAGEGDTPSREPLGAEKVGWGSDILLRGFGLAGLSHSSCLNLTLLLHLYL